MKKYIALILAVLFVALLVVGCAPKTEQPSVEATEPPAADAPAAPETPAEPAVAGYEIALITDIGTIDDKSFNQSAWEGVVQYCEETGTTHQYYQPAEQSTEAYLTSIGIAIEGGAKVIVTPGYLFEVPIFQAQDMYPDTKFILIDGSPNNGDWSAGAPEYRCESNVVGILYAEEQAGYLAGYASVKDGFTKFGFLGGMAVPAVVRFGYGFVQGVDAAAAELGVQCSVQYHYTGGFAATPEAQALATSWYNDGVEVIFGCGGAVGNSAMAAAEAMEGKWVIGVDKDQSPESYTVISSAMKGLKASVYATLKQYAAGSFPGGQVVTMDASQDGVELPMANSKFRTFSQADYDALFAKLAGGTVKLLKDTDVASAAEITCTNTTVTVVE